jgi:hypothetical protein
MARYSALFGCDTLLRNYSDTRLNFRQSFSMRSRQSETLLLLPLLPVFVVGIFPMLLFGLLGFLGISLFGILLICVGLADGLNASDTFNQQIIVHGYANRANRPNQAMMHSAVRFALLVDMIGAGLVATGLCGFFYFG